MATFVVTTNIDENNAGATAASPGGAGLSLREAAALANANAGADTITFAANVFTGGAASLIRLTQGEIAITDAVTIDGSTATGIVITGDNLNNDITVAGTDVTDVGASGAPLLADNSRIFNITSAAAPTTLDSLTLTGGRTGGAGGAIQSNSVLTIIDGTVSGNSTTGSFGGGISGGLSVSLTNSTVSGNFTEGISPEGGGIRANGTVTLTNSTVYGNQAIGSFADGGGIYSNDQVSLINSTVSGNSVFGQVAAAGGIFSIGAVSLTNSIVLGNLNSLARDDRITAPSVSANGLNIVGTGNDTNASDGIINADPTIVFAQTVDLGGVVAGVLANNGGPVQTVALKLAASNPALDASNASAPLLDAAGNARFDLPGIANVNGNAADLGAVEAKELPSLVVTTNQDVVNAFDGLTSLREAIAYANSHANANANTPDVITFDNGLAGSVIRLGASGTLAVTDALTIDGDTDNDGKPDITISGDRNNNDVHAAGSTTITDIAASKTSSTLGDNVQILLASESLTIDGLILTGGVTTGTGGAVSGVKELTIEHSQLVGNAANIGGAAYADTTSTFTVSDTLVAGNAASFVAGGLNSTNILSLTNVTISGNTAVDIGGAGAGAAMFATNVTVIGNSASGSLGGLSVSGSLTLQNSTVTGNAAHSFGGVGADALSITNSIIAGNEASSGLDPDISGLRAATGLNIVGIGNDTDKSDNIINAPSLGAVFATLGAAANTGISTGVLADNGGFVPTIALKLDAANPALDAATGTPPATDARGEGRQDLAGVGSDGTNFADLGAFEAIDQPPIITALPLFASIVENTSTAAAIKFANLTVVDSDGNNTLSLSGADAALFELQSDGIYLKAGTVLDFETNPVLDVTLNVATLGNGTVSAPASFLVTDVNEAPTAVNFTNVLASIAENASTAARIKVANIVITDDALGSETITLAGADAAKFEVINGVLYIKAGAVLDFESNPKLDVTVNVDDPTVGGPIDLSRALSITVTDVLEALNGTPKADALNGSVGADRINGLAGNDTINGGGGGDKIIGGAGADVLIGGPGSDTFIFASTTDSAYKVSGQAVERGPLIDAGISLRDVITDFTVGVDKIDVSLIDANENIAGNQAFTFRGTGNFAGAGSIVYRQFDNAGTANDHTVVYFDTTGDGRSDMLIALNGLKALAVSDFIL